MPPEFCPEHTEWIRCVGALEANQKNQGETINRIETKIDKYAEKVDSKIESLQRNGEKKSVLEAAAQAKSRLLFWGLAILGVVFLTGMGNLVLSKLGLK